jgi:hypothetical protein
MRTEHLAIDGSVVSIEADADLSTPATATGWAIVPSLMRAHPFTVSPAGHSAAVEEAVRAGFASVQATPAEEFAMKGGTLRVAEVEVPTATGGTRALTVAAWEGASGCLHTSLSGRDRPRIVEAFESLQFGETRRGLAIHSPITPRPREPMVIKEVPELGVLGIQPAIPSVLQGVPRSRGRAIRHGELFRIRAARNALMYVSSSVVVRIDPIDDRVADAPTMVSMAEGLRVEWVPPRRR